MQFSLGICVMCLSLLCKYTGHAVSGVPGPHSAKDIELFSVFPMWFYKIS